MDAREAVELAKGCVADLFEVEPINEIGLEEVERKGSSWVVTIGFSRVWPVSSGVVKTLRGTERTYKQVSIDVETGTVQSLRHRNVSGTGLSDA